MYNSGYVYICIFTWIAFYPSNAQIEAPYNPIPLMDSMDFDEKKGYHFLVFGDSKHSAHLQDVLGQSDKLKPDFCLTTADLVDKGAGPRGVLEYQMLEDTAGWFFRKYPTWTTLGNHEIYDSNKHANYQSGAQNFADFFGLSDPTYSFDFANARFIAMDWPEIDKDPAKLVWLENELKSAEGKHIFIFRHRPFYTVGTKSHFEVDGKPSLSTKLFKKYNVSAVFSGHDHIYYRTFRDQVYYVISAGAGAFIYPLDRESEAISGDVYYGRMPGRSADGKLFSSFKYRHASGHETFLDQALYYLVSVKVKGNRIKIRMIDSDGKVWDSFSFKNRSVDEANWKPTFRYYQDPEKLEAVN
ncbi:MAG: hypothetical protein HKN87_23420 [Saprospiraceae bacterium]|nr:hypothetical protein [Saprospiraceae bacterium]